MSEKYSISYRPQTFDDVCGNTETIHLLKEKSRIGKIGKMLIIHGTSGIGKTTLIYILAKAYLCKNLRPDGNPCCECESCKEIQDSLYQTGSVPRGSNIEIFDLGKDGDEYGYINKITQRVNAKFVRGKRVLILEEMHNTDLKNQQKLNKSLEFIPEDVLVLIPTSDFYTKISPHLKTRADSYLLTNPDRKQIVDYLYDLSQKPELLASAKTRITKKDLLRLVTLKNSNMRECVDGLETLIECGDIGKAYIMGDYNKKLEEFINYMTAVKMGVIELTQYVQNLENKATFLQSLSKLLEQAVTLRSVANDLVEPEKRKEIIGLMKGISEIKIAKIIRNMPKVYNTKEDDAQMYLWALGIELNSAMSEQVNLKDEENNVMYAKDGTGDTVDIMQQLFNNSSNTSKCTEDLPLPELPTVDDEPGNTISGEFNIDDL